MNLFVNSPHWIGDCSHWSKRVYKNILWLTLFRLDISNIRANLIVSPIGVYTATGESDTITRRAAERFCRLFGLPAFHRGRCIGRWRP